MKQLLILCLIVLSACNQNEKKTETLEPLYDYDIEKRLEELKINLSPAPPPVASPISQGTLGVAISTQPSHHEDP